MKNAGIDQKYLLQLGFKDKKDNCFEKYYFTPIGKMSVYVSFNNTKFWVYGYEREDKLTNLHILRQGKLHNLPKVLDWLEGRKERK